MPDLQPDLSMYPKAGSGSMSLGDLLSLATRAQEYSGRQSLSDAIKQSADPATGDIDINKARGVLNQTTGFRDPSQDVALLHAQQEQRSANQLRLNTVAGYAGQLVALGNRATSQDVARMSTAAAEVMGPQGAALFNKVVTGAGPIGSPEWLKNLQVWKNTLGPQQYGTVQTPQGALDVPAEQKAIGAATGGVFSQGGGDEAWKAASDRMANYKQRVQPLEQAVSILNRMPEGSTYPGAEGANRIKTFLLANAPETAKSLIKSLNPDNVKDFTELHKYLTDWTNQVSLGMHSSDAAMYSAVAANPSTSMHQAAARDVAKVRLGTERMQHALSQEFASSGLAPSQFNTWQAKNANALDPRAFVFDAMTNEQRDRLTKGMKPTEWQKFKRSLDLAEKYQLTSPKAGWGTE